MLSISLKRNNTIPWFEKIVLRLLFINVIKLQLWFQMFQANLSKDGDMHDSGTWRQRLGSESVWSAMGGFPACQKHRQQSKLQTQHIIRTAQPAHQESGRAAGWNWLVNRQVTLVNNDIELRYSRILHFIELTTDTADWHYRQTTVYVVVCPSCCSTRVNVSQTWPSLSPCPAGVPGDRVGSRPR